MTMPPSLLGAGRQSVLSRLVVSSRLIVAIATYRYALDDSIASKEEDEKERQTSCGGDDTRYLLSSHHRQRQQQSNRILQVATSQRLGEKISGYRIQRTLCEVNKIDESDSRDFNNNDDDDDSYPNFSRHGKDSLLKKYLTPEVYRQLKDKRTASGDTGVTLEDMIRAGVSLPWGANPPRGVAGVYAGDAESYQTFAALLDPLIAHHHKSYYYVQSSSRRGGKGSSGEDNVPLQVAQKIRRHETNLNPKQLVQQRIDPNGEYILSTRMRLSRSLEGFRFSPCISRSERRAIERLFQDCCSDWKKGRYIRVHDMSNSQHDDLIRRRILYPDPDDFALSAGTHRDWPDARGIYCEYGDGDGDVDCYNNEGSLEGGMPSLMIWCNMEDHLWIISNAKGGDVQGVFSRLSKAVWALETSLQSRGHAFVEDDRLGFLNASLSNIGTGLRASVYVKLVRLGRQPGFEKLIERLRLISRAEYPQSDKRYTGVFDIGNAESLGKSEVELINIMIRGVAKLIELEKRLEKGEQVDLALVR